MKYNKSTNKDKSIRNKQLLFPVISILLIVIVSFYWQTLSTKKEKNSSNQDKIQSLLKQGKLTFISPDSAETHSIIIEIAEDDYSRANGLMFREELPENQGMLFIFDTERLQYFWMKNTPVSLDMIFANQENTVVHIEKYTKPYSTQSYPSEQPALYVIEVVAGYSDQYGVGPGWKINWQRY